MNKDKSLEDDVIDLDRENAEELLKSIILKIESPIHLSNLKDQILKSDSAFSEKRYGFKNFTSYIESFDFNSLEKDMVSYRKPI